jgi:flagellar hook-basal body complex protein FliE
LTLPPSSPQPTNQAAGQGQSQGQGQPANQPPNQPASQSANQGPNQTPNQAAALPSAPSEKRGFLNDFGQWWNDSIANFNAKMKEQQAKLDEFNKQQSDAAKDATQAMKKAAGAMFTPSKLIEIQQLCPVAGNGAPDCATAATDVCKGKGFSAGQPIDIRTAERCKASLWVSGQNPAVACPVETVLLRVACQE